MPVMQVTLTQDYIFFISGGPVSWQSRMQTSVALSSMEAEYMAASAATQEAMWQARYWNKWACVWIYQLNCMKTINPL